MRVTVRDNDVEQALRVLKKKLTLEGFFRDLRGRAHFVKPSEERRVAQAASVRRSAKAQAKRDAAAF